MAEGKDANGIRRFFTWWIAELSRVLTPTRSGKRTWQTLLLHTPEGLQVSANVGGANSPIGTLKAGATPDQIAGLRKLIEARASRNPKQVLLRLSDADVVQHTIQIPGAASDVIEPVIDNQMERIVPWPREDTSYGYRVLGPNAEAPDQLDIQVVATTKRILDGALQRAQVLGLAPSAVDFASATEAATPVEIVSLEADPVKATADRLRIVLAIGLVCSVAIGALGLYSVWDRQLQSDDLEAKIAIAQSRVAEVKRLNDENAALREQREHLVRRKKDDPAVIMLIEALSRALPDSAYLEELEIQGREARIVGKAADPTGLITTLEDTPEFEDVRFSAPTTREGHETLGTFSIVGRTQQGSSAEKKP